MFVLIIWLLAGALLCLSFFKDKEKTAKSPRLIQAEFQRPWIDECQKRWRDRSFPSRPSFRSRLHALRGSHPGCSPNLRGQPRKHRLRRSPALCLCARPFGSHSDCRDVHGSSQAPDRVQGPAQSKPDPSESGRSHHHPGRNLFLTLNRRSWINDRKNHD